MTVYLDNAATTSPKPRSVINATQNAMMNLSANPGRGGHHLAMAANDMIYSVREQAADFFNAQSALNVVFTPNCTTALNTAIFGILSGGGHAIISPFEHNAVLRPLTALSARGVQFDIASYSTDDDITVKNFEKLIKNNTRAIICTHASNVFGMVLPIEKLGNLCKNHGIYFIVDAAQTAGILDIDVMKMNIGALAVAAHKGLYAPTGAGLLITDGAHNPLIYGGTGGDSRRRYLPDDPPDKYESGTLNTASINGIGAGISFVKSRRNRYLKNEHRQINYVNRVLSQTQNVILYSDTSAGNFVPVLSFNIKNLHSEQVAKQLDSFGICVRAGLHCAPLAHEHMGTADIGTVRVAVSAFTTDNEIDYFLRCVKIIANKQ